MRCKICDRVKATENQYKEIPADEGEHLCWGDWSPQQCQQEAVDWKEKYDKLLVNFKNLDRYNDVLSRLYNSARSLRNSGYDGKFIGEATRDLFNSIKEVELYERQLESSREKTNTNN